MKVLNITLKTPDLPSLVSVGVMTAIILTIASVLILTGLTSTLNAFLFSIGGIGGSLAHAYGVSVKESGWRGAVLSTLFSLALMIFVYLLMHV